METPLPTQRKGFYQSLHDSELWIEHILVENPREDTVLVFLHEALGSVRQWRDFPDQLCARLGLHGLIYDRVGHGSSSPLPETRKPDYMHREAREYLLTLLHTLGIRQPIFVGHSDGGSIALIYAALTGNCRGLICEAGHIVAEAVTREGIRRMRKVLLDKGLGKKLEKYHGDKSEALIKAWADTWLSPPFGDWDLSPLLPDIMCPVLIIQGENDEYASPQHPLWIQEGLGGESVVHRVPHCGHAPHLEKPDDILEVMSSFIHKI